MRVIVPTMREAAKEIREFNETGQEHMKIQLTPDEMDAVCDRIEELEGYIKRVLSVCDGFHSAWEFDGHGAPESDGDILWKEGADLISMTKNQLRP